MDKSILEYFAQELTSGDANYSRDSFKTVYASAFIRIDVCEEVYDALENKGYLELDGDREVISEKFFEDYDR